MEKIIVDRDGLVTHIETDKNHGLIFIKQIENKQVIWGVEDLQKVIPFLQEAEKELLGI